MRVYQEPAFILHASAYRETSLLLEVYSRHHGRIGLVARGARRAQHTTRALLTPFLPLLVNWSGKGELATLAGVDTESAAIRLERDALFCGLYLNELLVRLLHRHDPHEELYDIYQSTLVRLLDRDHVMQTLRLFEKHLLQELGYGLVLEHESNGNSPIVPALVYDYVPERGPVVAGREVLGVKVHGTTLLALAAECMTDPDILRESKNLMRACLAPHLGDRPLHSRKLFRPGVVNSGPLNHKVGMGD